MVKVSPVARLMSLVREERLEVSAVFFFAILSGLVQLTIPVGIQSIIGFVLSGTISASLTVLITVLVLAVLFTGIIQVKQMKVIEKIQQRIFVRYSFAFADRIPRLDLKKVDGFYLPELVNRFFDTVSLQKGIAKLLLELPLAVIQILFGLILLSFYHPIFIFFGLFVLMVLWLILRTTGYKGLQSSLAESTSKYGLVGWLEEMARLVKSFKFSNSRLHLEKADIRTTRYLKARTRHFRVLELQFKVLIAFKLLITGAMLVGGVWLLLEQKINIGQFVAAEIIIITVITSIEKVINNLDSVYDVMTAVEKVGKVTDKPVENEGTYKLSPTSSIIIRAERLSFGYDDRPVLHNLNFCINPGEKVCISGEAGSGKSTLLKLLTGVYSDLNGTLLINNLPISSYDLSSLRNRMGILFQQENIFHGTLWENLTMGRPLTRKEYIDELCEKTGLQSFLAGLPAGFETELDPAGKRLPRRPLLQRIYKMHSFTEENYLKAIYKLQETNGEVVATSALAQVMGVHAPSVTDMLKRMAKKKLVTYQKSKGFKLTEKGKQVAVGIIRNHRLWEVFLVEKLGFRWDEVHELAEQLEHIHSEDLTNKLDKFLGFPKADPHGDPIPDANGVLPKSKAALLSSLKVGEQGTFTGVMDHTPAFLNYLDKVGIALGSTLKVTNIEEFDQTVTLQIKSRKEVIISHKVANSLLIG